MLKKGGRKNLAHTALTIGTNRGTQQYHLTRRRGELSELPCSVKLDSSGNPESIVQVHHWVWVQYEKENGNVDNNLALVVAILRYRDGTTDIAVLWGREMQERSNAESQRVICTDECLIVEIATIGSRVTEEESGGCVVTENSVGENFSLDRYHIISTSDEHVARLEFILFETQNGRPLKHFTQEVKLAEGASAATDSQGLSDLAKETVQEQANAQSTSPRQELIVDTPGESAAQSKSAIDPDLEAGPMVLPGVDSDRPPECALNVKPGTEADGEADIKAVAEEADTAESAAQQPAMDEAGMVKVAANSDGMADGTLSLESDGTSDLQTDMGGDAETDQDTGFERDKQPDTRAGAEVRPGSVARNISSEEPEIVDQGRSKAESTREGRETPKGDRNASNETARPAKSRKRGHDDTSSVEEPQKKSKARGSKVALHHRENALSETRMIMESAKSANIQQDADSASPADEDTEREVFFIRHKLQRYFLRDDHPPSESNLSSADKLLKWLETNLDSARSVIHVTKITVVLKRMISRSPIPGEQHHDFKKRCQALIAAWGKPQDKGTRKAGSSNPRADVTAGSA
ncbi:hypothetical protein LTR86_011000 [Recurvomyces mirabilis]|nr:hypothetical protein LTR86_011000 [Recurvomyces mirabilis]